MLGGQKQSAVFGQSGSSGTDGLAHVRRGLGRRWTCDAAGLGTASSLFDGWSTDEVAKTDPFRTVMSLTCMWLRGRIGYWSEVSDLVSHTICGCDVGAIAWLVGKHVDPGVRNDRRCSSISPCETP